MDRLMSALACTTGSFRYRASCWLRYGSMSERRTPVSGMAPITGSVSAGPGPTAKVLLSRESPSTWRRMRSPTWNPLPASCGAGAVAGACARAQPRPAVTHTHRTERLVFIVTPRLRSSPGYAAGPRRSRAARRRDRPGVAAGLPSRTATGAAGRRARAAVAPRGGADRHCLTRDRGDAAAARLHLLHVRDHLGGDRVLGRHEPDRHVLVDHGD